jgi:hypothetical protein
VTSPPQEQARTAGHQVRNHTRRACVQFEGALPAEHSVANVDVIHPCTQRHIAKYSAQRTVVVLETPGVYARVTRPHMAGVDPAALQWVYNILDKKKEAERLLFEDEDEDIGFMLHPDLKWDQSQARLLTSRDRSVRKHCTLYCSSLRVSRPHPTSLSWLRARQASK